MLDVRPILYITGLLLLPVGVAMLLPMLLDLHAGRDTWTAFAGTGAATTFLGVSLALACRQKRFALDIRQTFLFTALSWTVVIALSALPFHVSSEGVSYTDAFFEATSGLTTTGSTVMTGLEERPPGVLLWRALLQWLGGVGIVLMAVAVMPLLRIGGMQFFRAEQDERTDIMHPSVGRISIAIILIYGGLTLVWTALLRLAGMGWFDAVCHAMTTMATGGYSTRDASVGAFDSPVVDAVVVLGMLIASLPFLAYRSVLQGRWKRLVLDTQVHAFLLIAAVSVLGVTFWLWTEGGRSLLDALRQASFNVISVLTGTGYTTEDYSLWGSGPVALLFLLMFVGGCTGSTTGGLRVFRIQVLAALVLSEIRKVARPRLVVTPHYAGRSLNENVTTSVALLAGLFLATFAVLAGILSAHGLDRVTSLSAAATAVSVVGPGLGPVVGPSGTFQPLPDTVKWALSAGMLLGRLEFFALFVILLPGFWRR